MHSRFVMLALAVVAAAFATGSGAEARTELPVSFEGNAVVFTPRLENGATMRILLDSGGYDLIQPGAVSRLALATTPMKLGTADRATVAFPPFRSDATIPAPSTRWLVARPNVFAGTFALDLDGTLGASWFLDHVVTVDYPLPPRPCRMRRRPVRRSCRSSSRNRRRCRGCRPKRSRWWT